jgi:polar amino acid transport system substrate-binding protein
MFRPPTVTKSTARATRALLASAGVTALLATGCASGESAPSVDANCDPIAEVETLNEGALTVLVAEHPPFVSMQGNELTGIEGELINTIAESLCLELDVQSTSFSAVIEGLLSGRADLSAGNWTVNDERRELFEISDALYSSGMGVVTQNEDWNTVEELEGRTLGTPQGYLWVDQLNDVFGGDNVRQYQTDTAVLDDVRSGRVEAGMVSLAANTWRLGQDQYSSLSIQEMEPTPQIPYTQELPLSVVLIEKGNTALRDATNEVVREYFESGQLEEALADAGLDPDTAYPENR